MKEAMNIAEQEVTFSGETFVLTNQRAAYWQRERALILSDLHLGKAAHYRKNGIALPRLVSVHDLQRLARLIAHYQAGQVIIAGDLIHAGANKEVALFGELTGQFPHTEFTLIRGNHDRFPDDQLKAIGISAVYPEWSIAPVRFVHRHDPEVDVPTISGHVHPGVSLPLPTGGRMRFPCYVVNEFQIILPAFSLFTGLDTSSVPEHAVCYAFYEDGIFRVG